MYCLDNEKYLYIKIFIFCQCRRRYVYDIISDAAVASNKLNKQIKQDAQTLSQKCDQLNNIGSRFGVPVPSCISLKLWVQTIAKLCNLSQIFATRSGDMKSDSK